MSVQQTQTSSIEPLETRIAPAFAAVIDPSSLNGLNGFTINGEAAGDYAGRVSDAGDVNGDGFADLLIGAQLADGNGVTDRGASYVVFGKAGGFAATLDLSTLNGANGFKINGVTAMDSAGASVSGAGDVNGDGFDDLIIGATGADPNGSMSGASYVVFGTEGGFAATLDLSTLNGTNGFKINGVAAADFSGVSVSGAGDVDGDGFGDLLIGALQADPNGTSSGASYVVFGKAAGFAPTFNLSTLNGVNGFKVNGQAIRDYSGISVSGAGDINGDGFDDVLIGAFQADPNGSNSGASYVVFGKAAGFAPTFNLSTLNGVNGFKINGAAADDYSGYSVSGAGDVNGDGFGDLLIGAPLADPNGSGSGASYVVFGASGAFAPTINFSTLNGANGFKINGVTAGDYAGVSVSGAGDVNGDGFADVLVGASGGNPNFLNQGAGYLVFGQAAGFAPTLNLSALNGANGFKLGGVMAGDYAGRSVSGAGDVNGDGFDDVIISAVGADSNGSLSGASYVVFGRGVEINVSDAVAVEGDADPSALQFTVSLSEAGTSPITVEATAFDGTAHVGSDYAALGQLGLTFAPGETSKTVTINVIGDTLYESDETLSIVLSDSRGGIIRDGAAIGTVGNDDGPPLVSITGGSVLEGDAATSMLTFTVSLSATSGLPAAVNFASADGTALAGSDYTALTPGTLSFAPGETTKTITLEVLGDTSIEDHDTLSVTLSDATGATIGNGTAIGTILNDDTAVRIVVPAADGLEGDIGTTPFVFTVSLEKASALPVTVNYATSDGTANGGSDFTATPAEAHLTFEPGETNKTITVDVLGDTSIEAHETFSVVLSSPINAAIASGNGMATILNDDTSIRIGDASVLEGHAGTREVTFNVTLTAPSALPVSVTFASADGTATAGADYTALMPGRLDFAPGETSKTLTVDVLGDTAVEPGETFSVVLSEGLNAFIDDATALGTILDDDVSVRGKHIATFTDVDGDLVTIKVSKGTLKVEDFTLFPSGSGAQLALVDFSDQTELAGANLSFTAKGAAGIPGGVRLVDVGAINATGIDLAKVMIKGDLGQIDSGNDLDPRPGLLSLRAHSLGQRGINTQLPGGSLQSEIVGAFKTLKLADGMQDAILSASGDIGSVAIKGDVLGSAIRTDGKIGVINIGGDLGSSGTISARGILAPASDAKALAIGAFSVGGSVDHAQILAGYDRTGAAVNADATIGRVTVGGNWTASDLAAGISRGTDEMFGTDDDALIVGGNGIIAKIASIVIKGAVNGTEGGTDHFGFVAEQIDAFRSGGARIALTRGPANDLAGVLVDPTGEVKVREAA